MYSGRSLPTFSEVLAASIIRVVMMDDDHPDDGGSRHL
jgi:hypothetical protein